MLEHFKDIRKIQEVLQEAQTGLWAIELDPDKAPRMYADSSMLKLLGFDSEPTPEYCYQFWYERIEDAYYPIVQTAVERIIQDNRAEVQYPWVHPQWGKIYVRCGGVRDRSYQSGVCLRGYHQNITHTVVLKQEYDSVVESLSKRYRSVFLCNLADKTYKTVKIAQELASFVSLFSNYEQLLQHYVNREVAPQYQGALMDLIRDGGIERRLAQGEKQIEMLYRTGGNGWRQVRIVPSAQYSPEYPLIIAAFDEQDHEIARRINDATAQVALSQIYTLVISIDPANAEYTCIHYCGERLSLERRGEFSDFYSQMTCKMPLEDQKIFDEILNPRYYEACRYKDGTFRLMDPGGSLHYYKYYSALIREEMGERLLLTVRNVDNDHAQQRELILSNLCKCYYSIYLFDLENNIEQTIWQEPSRHESRDFPKENLADYYERFIQRYVYEADQDKMRRAGSAAFLRQTLSGEQSVYDIDFRRVYPDHLSWVRSRFSVAEMRDGIVTKVIFANMDINEQKLEEMEEEKRKRLYFEYRNIVQGLSAFYHSVFYVDLEKLKFQIFKVKNDLSNILHGGDDYDLLRQTCSRSIIYEADRPKFDRDLCPSEIRRRITGGETIYSLEYRRDYGGYFGWMRIHIILAESKNGAPAKIVLAAHSVEEEKEQEEQNRKALLAAYETAKAANEAKSNFLAQMSHDIRTPINAIIGMSAIAASQVHNPEKITDCLNKIDLSSKHLLTLINEILDLSKIEKGKVELVEKPFSLRGLIHDIGSMVRPDVVEKQQQLLLESAALTHDRLIGDARRLCQVLLNFVTNAVKYTPSGGKITLLAQEVSQPAPDYGCFVFTVEDNGIGMSKNFLDYIFVPFSRADDVQVQNAVGSGLGMSIAQRLVSAMGGNIQVSSELGQGSRFTITLNLKLDLSVHESASAAPSGADEERLPCGAAFPKGKRLLLAEDNELNMEIAQTLLEDMGFTVQGVKDGQAALDAFTHSQPGAYHAILMDLQMPVMDGYTATHKIRSSGHPQAGGIPIIALTANAFTEDVAKCLAAGMNDHIAKPIDYDRLLKVLRKNMD